MSEVEVAIIKTVTLILDEREAIWLKGIVQNPLHNINQPEPEEDKLMRSALFEALNKGN